MPLLDFAEARRCVAFRCRLSVCLSHLPNVPSCHNLARKLPLQRSRIMASSTATTTSGGQSSSCSHLPTTYLLLDLNGNLHVGDTPTSHAIEALSRLSRLVTASSSSSHRRLRIAFCSNSSKESTRSLVARLRKMGFTDEEALPEGSVFTSLDVARRRLLADERPSNHEVKGQQRRTLLLLGEDAMKSFPEDSHDEGNSAPASSSRPSRSFKPPPSTLPADLDATQRQALESCDSVLIGLAPDLMRYEWLTEAFRILSGEYAQQQQQQSTEQPRPAPLLVATHSGRYLRPGDGGALALGPGPFVKALCHAADLAEDDERTVVCVGKPERQFFAQCLEGMGWQRQQQRGGEGEKAEKDEAWIVGDDARQDLSLPVVKEGKDDPLDGLKVRRALVRTGKYREGDEEKVAGREEGDLSVWDSFAAWVDDFVREWERGV